MNKNRGRLPMEVVNMENLISGGFLGRTELPSGGAGGRRGAKTIAIGEKGQVRFSALASKEIGKRHLGALVEFNLAGKVVLQFAEKPWVKGRKDEEYIQLSAGKGEKEGKALVTAFAGYLKWMKEKGYEYDYSNSGTQVFPVELNEAKDGSVKVEFTLPKGVKEKRAFTPRARKNGKNAMAAAAASGGETQHQVGEFDPKPDLSQPE